jgi:hypothetical protein
MAGRTRGVTGYLRPTMYEQDYEHQIPPELRRDLLDLLSMEKVVWSGRLGDLKFLDRLYDLENLPSDDGRFAAFEIDESLVAVGSVAVGDVAGEGVRERVPVEVVGVLDDELADRQEVALDAVEITRRSASERARCCSRRP